MGWTADDGRISRDRTEGNAPRAVHDRRPGHEPGPHGEHDPHRQRRRATRRPPSHRSPRWSPCVTMSQKSELVRVVWPAATDPTAPSRATRSRRARTAARGAAPIATPGSSDCVTYTPCLRRHIPLPGPGAGRSRQLEPVGGGREHEPYPRLRRPELAPRPHGLVVATRRAPAPMRPPLSGRDSGGRQVRHQLHRALRGVRQPEGPASRQGKGLRRRRVHRDDQPADRHVGQPAGDLRARISPPAARTGS